MTRWLQAAVAAEGPADRTDKTDQTRLHDTATAARQRPREVLSDLSVLSAAAKSDGHGTTVPFLNDGSGPKTRLGAPYPEIALTSPDPAGAVRFPYGCAPNGNPRTWTGRIVSLDDWRTLSEWDRHGSTGKLWNALTGRWEAAPTGGKPVSAPSRFQPLDPSLAPQEQER